MLLGDPDVECTGIAVTCCGTLEVLHKAVEAGCNLIVSHEGVTYNYEYGGPVDENIKNDVLQEKLRYARENGLVVWRDHDHMHGGGKPGSFIERKREDMIFYGTMKELGWEHYVVGDKMKPLWYGVPKQSARELANEIMEKWNLNGLRIVGNPDAIVENVFIIEHVNGGERDIPKVDEAQKADVIIPLEICDYTVTSYIRDAAYLGRNKVIFEMGHFNAEELGMKYLEKTFPAVFNNEIPVRYIQSGDTFSYILRNKQ